MPPDSTLSEPRPLDAFPGLRGVRAFFTTRRGGLSAGPYASLNLGPFSGDDPELVRANWGILLESQGLPGRDAALPLLRHGSAMTEFRPGKLAETRATEADAVFTHAPGAMIAVTLADCLAALVVDVESGCVAAVHAGWRGTRDDILGRALSRLFAEGRCRPDSTRVALGPCLSVDALEVGEEVAATLPAAHVVRAGGAPRFDLRGCNRSQAIAAGVPADRVTDVGGCTRENSDLYFSYRRDAGVTGRMAACIALV